MSTFLDLVTFTCYRFEDVLYQPRTTTNHPTSTQMILHYTHPQRVTQRSPCLRALPLSTNQYHAYTESVLDANQLRRIWSRNQLRRIWSRYMRLLVHFTSLTPSHTPYPSVSSFYFFFFNPEANFTI